MPPKANSKVQTKQKTKAATKQKYVPGGLVETHWPIWDIHSRETRVVDTLDWIQNVRYKVGDYDTKLDAFPVSFTKYANTTTATTTTRIYIPAIYRPIFRLLQSKLCWHQIAYSMPAPILKRKASNNEYTDFLVRKARYEVWHDGAMHNIIYCNSIRESFFHWIEDTYYRGNSAIGKRPGGTKMSRGRRCILIENWMMHELLIMAHTNMGVKIWMCDKDNVRLWDGTRDVFSLNWDKFGEELTWYGRPLDRNKPDDVPFIQQQNLGNIKGFPIEEEFDQIRRSYSSVIKDFFNQIMDNQLNYAAPMKLVPIVHELGELDEVDDEDDEDFEPSSFESDDSSDSATAMDIDDPTEVATIRDEVMAQWGGGMDLKMYKAHSNFLKGTGQRPPGQVPDGYESESDDSDTDKRLRNRRMGTVAEDSTNGSASEHEGSGSEADNQPGTNPGEPGEPIEEADPEDKDPVPEAAKVAKTGPKKGRKKNRRGKKKSVRLIIHSDHGDEEDNADVDVDMHGYAMHF
ncbi:hypothetical protein PILCRDRAFT_92537 [Piloderma croceum F 1598]|uniref:Uncharacterized protein n=1 Tax=Piloderma croceum (strain F 1598) TaxID=765440 RepID=A0A0C3F3K5_PILCF|nr:hypothetical protein PILCRDRAFT_92537 [Piloderma croceum F 1598]